MNIERLRQMCLAFPHATEDVKWGNDLCFSVSGKMFCVAGLTSEPLTVSFKVAAADFDALTSRNGLTPAPYMARYHWILAENPQAMPEAEWQTRIGESYQLVFDKLPLKIRKEIGLNNAL